MRPHPFAVLLAALTLVLLAGSRASPAQPTGAWRNLASVPTPRQELATAVLNGRIYVIAGYDTEGLSSATVEVYDPNTDRWTSAAPIPQANNHNAAAVAGGRLYSFGGNWLEAYVYDEVNNFWSPVARPNFIHGETPAVGVLNDKIYVAGGFGPSARALERYDPATDTWTSLAPMRVGRNHCGGAFLQGRFYVAAGRGSPDAPTALEAYDPATNTWTNLPSMPTGRSGVAVAAVDGELFVFGGELPDLHAEVEAYNPATNSWRRLPRMPQPRHGIWASVIGNQVFLPGGAGVQGLGASNVNDVFTVGESPPPPPPPLLPPPVVAVNADQPGATLAPRQKGSFTVSRRVAGGGDLSSALTVRYRVGGSAIGGVDYQTLPGTVTIPAGAVSAKVEVKPLPGADLAGGSKTVKLKLTAGEGYFLTEPVKATVTLSTGP